MNGLQTIVLSVDGGLAPEAVAGALWTDAKTADGAAASAPRAGDAGRRTLIDAPPLLDRSLLGTFEGSERTHLEEEERAVLDRIRASTRALTGESAPTWSMGALAEPWLHLRAGTVVCRRESSVADLVIALPNLHVDRRTGRVRLGTNLGDEAPEESSAPAALPLHTTSRVAVRVDEKDDERPPREGAPGWAHKVVEVGLIGLDFAGVVADVKVVSGGIKALTNLIHLFFPSSGGSATLPRQIADTVKAALATQEQQNAMSDLHSYHDEATGLVSTLKSNSHAFDGADFRILAKKIVVDSQVDLAKTLRRMQDSSATFDDNGALTELDTAAFRVWRYGTSVMLLAYKLAWMGDEGVLLANSGFLDTILRALDRYDAFAKQVSEAVQQAVDRRIAQISAVEPYTDFRTGPSGTLLRTVGLRFVDRGSPNEQQFFFPNGGCQADKERWKEAEARRTKRIAGVTATRLARLHWTEADHVETFRKELAKLKEEYQRALAGRGQTAPATKG